MQTKSYDQRPAATAGHGPGSRVQGPGRRSLASVPSASARPRLPSTVYRQRSRVKGQGSRATLVSPRSIRVSASPSTVYRLPTTARSGISLLEVLIAIFVMSIGLFGVMSLLPVGQYQLAQMNKLDRGGTLGRAAFREVATRGLLRPERWITRQGNLWKDFDPNNPLSYRIEPFVIDPLALDRDLSDPTDTAAAVGFFPYFADPLAESAFQSGVQMPRLNLILANFADPSEFDRANAAMAERIFRGGDDLIFVRPDDAQLRPHMLQPTNSPLLQQPYDGNYSWLMTVAPAASEEWSRTFVSDRRLFTVSVVVFYRRKLPLPPAGMGSSSPPTERLVRAIVAGGGLGGGSVHLVADRSVNLKNIRPNGWLLLCGRLGTVPAGVNPLVFRWYRIVSVDDTEGLKLDPPQRDVMVSGPDWDPTSFAGGTFAILVDDVVGVYQKTIQLDRTSPWGG